MHHVVTTGLGIVSCFGNDKDTVSVNLRVGRPGIRFDPSYAEMGLRSHASGSVDLSLEELIDRKIFHFMDNTVAYACLVMEQTIKDSGLAPEQISNPRTGPIAGSGGASTLNQMEAIDTLHEKGAKRIGPYRAARITGSTISACLATPFQIKDVNYSIFSACTTSTHCIGRAIEQIQLGKQDVVFTDGSRGEHWSQSCLFDATGTLSTQYNETPEKVSRAYDVKRGGFVIVDGNDMVMVEELEHALKCGVEIYTEVVSYDATSNGYDMVAPNGEGAIRYIQQALAIVDAPIDYLNTYDISTPVGNIAGIRGVHEMSGDKMSAISLTENLSGHSLDVADVHETIYCLLMTEGGFIAGSANIDELDPEAADLPILREAHESTKPDTVISNNFGFGGTNATLVLKCWQG